MAKRNNQYMGDIIYKIVGMEGGQGKRWEGKEQRNAEDGQRGV